MEENHKSAWDRDTPALLQSSDVILELPVLAAAAAAQRPAGHGGHGLEGGHHCPELPLRRLHEEAEGGAAVPARDCGRLQGQAEALGLARQQVRRCRVQMACPCL